MATTNKSFRPNKKDIKYLSKDFNQFKSNLISYTQTYWPSTYKDFNTSSPGMMFIELASYVGDVLSYYTDYQLNESMLINATERKNIITLAKSMGYKVKATTPAITNVEVFQLLPSTQDATGSFIPDYTYAQNILEGCNYQEIHLLVI